MTTCGGASQDKHEQRARSWLGQYVRADPPTRRSMVRNLALPIKHGISIAWGPAFERRYNDEAWAEAIAELARSLAPEHLAEIVDLTRRGELLAHVEEELGERARRVVARALLLLEERHPDGTAP